MGKAGEAVIVDLLKVDNSTTRLACLQQLGKSGKAPKSAVPDLVKALGDSDADVRVLAAYVLGQIGPDAKEALPALTRALKDRNAKVRAVVQKVIAKIKGE
jgi:HEAT repeat protein